MHGFLPGFLRYQAEKTLWLENQNCSCVWHLKMQKGGDTVSVHNLLTGCADLQVDCWGSGDSCYGQQVAVWARGKANGGNPFLRTRTPGSWFCASIKVCFQHPISYLSSSWQILSYLPNSWQIPFDNLQKHHLSLFYPVVCFGRLSSFDKWATHKSWRDIKCLVAIWGQVFVCLKHSRGRMIK